MHTPMPPLENVEAGTAVIPRPLGSALPSSWAPYSKNPRPRPQRAETGGGVARSQAQAGGYSKRVVTEPFSKISWIVFATSGATERTVRLSQPSVL